MLDLPRTGFVPKQSGTVEKHEREEKRDHYIFFGHLTSNARVLITFSSAKSS